MVPAKTARKDNREFRKSKAMPTNGLLDITKKSEKCGRNLSKLRNKVH
jgi:hypothetical protein